MSDNPHDDPEARQRWEEAYLHGRRQLWLRRLRLRRFFRARRDGRVLELGCGDGLNLRILRQLGYRRLVGLEYSVDLLLRNPAGLLLAGDGHDLPLGGDTFDGILVDSVLHHLTDYPRAARELRRVLRPGGWLVYFEPRPGVLRTLLDRITLGPLGRFLPVLRHRHDTILEELPLYTRWLRDHAEMERALRAEGLEARFYRRGPIGMFVGFAKPLRA
ncbi:MAG TPA: class I SAM-dependent methyltransferase [Thermoanaerobaculia bacterium]|nr:class I SAM-dependent methyltransferase [Thermoanaerobaculia bacterium]